MKVGVLTSSRADYGIYLPLLKKLKEDKNFDLSIIAFGSHCSKKYGRTVDNIKQDGFIIFEEIKNLIDDDSPKGITKSYAKTVDLFADFWHKNDLFDLVLCLGDRFEMAAAVNSGIPFKVNFAHIHGGDTTLGAIDNIYRHQITLASKLHFPTLMLYKKRILDIIGSDKESYVKVTGALSLDNLNEIPLISKDDFFKKWNIDLNQPSILITIHPETIDFNMNESYCLESVSALEKLKEDYQLIITMPNADTSGSVFRNAFVNLNLQDGNKVKMIENFGIQSYFTCMKHVSFLLGNTSSGIVEAASFKKYVINLGDRQKGRFTGNNVIHCPFNSTEILNKVESIKDDVYEGENPYYRGGAADIIIQTIKRNFNE
jgi:GDP/UDP-N,N'-diacetylbacillosamine 2-epimerase (hydrolysing)